MNFKVYALGLTGLFLTGLNQSSLGQNSFKQKLAKFPKTETKLSSLPQASTQSTTPGNSTQALWDIRFQYEVLGSSGAPDLAGIGYAAGKFWATRWQTANVNQVATFDSTGQYIETLTIAGIGNLRSLTYDGQYLYGGNVTNAIQIVDPVNSTRVGQFTVPTAVGQVRWITYNPEGNGGAGSFFVGNYSTAIFQITKPAVGGAATVINSIPATSHGLDGMYGVVYEANGDNSRFWVHNQTDPNGGASNSVIVQLDIDGSQTGITHDVDNDFGATGTGGGIGFALIPGFDTPTLFAMAQGNGLIGYNTQLAAVDIAAEKITTGSGLVAWPAKLNFPASLKTTFRSLSNTTQTAIPARVEIRDFTEDTLSQGVDLTPFNLPSLVSSVVTTNLNNSALHAGVAYEASAVVAQPNDENTSNDTAFALFGVTDSTIAWDYAYFVPEIASPIGIGGAATNNKGLGCKFSTPKADTLTSISFFLAAPFEGQETSVSVYRVTAAGAITTLRGTTGTYTATAEDEQNGVLVTLPLATPLAIPIGSFFVAVNELGDSTAGLGSFAGNYIGNTFFVKATGLGTGAWTEVGSLGVPVAFSVYPNFGKAPVITSTKSLTNVKSLNIAPNPTTGLVRVTMQVKNSQDVKMEVTNSLGQKINTIEKPDFGAGQVEIDLSGQKPGVYFLRLAVGNQVESYPVVLTH